MRGAQIACGEGVLGEESLQEGGGREGVRGLVKAWRCLSGRALEESPRKG